MGLSSVACLFGSCHRHHLRRLWCEQRLSVCEEVDNYHGVMEIRYGYIKEARLVTPVVCETIEIQGILEPKKTRGLIPTDTAGGSHHQVLSMKKSNWS